MQLPHLRFPRVRRGVSGPPRLLGSRGKDLRSFAGVSRWPLLSYLHKLRLPARKPPPEGFQKLSFFLASNRWTWLYDYVRFRIGRKHRFLTYADPARDAGVYPLAGDADGAVRIALASDWGTGTDEAAAVAGLITAFRPHYTVHLGDVYFVGDPAEVRENFLGMHNPGSRFTPCRWPVGSNGAFALNGNHEMYARGLGYFGLMLPAMGLQQDGKAAGQGASFFCLRNPHWQVIGLDTGYNSIGLPFIEKLVRPRSELPGPLLDWLRDQVFPQPDGRGIVLLSHHQYCSRFDAWYTAAAEQLAAFIERPVLWFWGHEHRLAVYERFQAGGGIQAYGRCIGHGGMPVEPTPAAPLHPDCVAEFLDERRYPNTEGMDVGVNGFVQLTFAGQLLRVEYVGIDAHAVFAEEWAVDGAGMLTRVSAAAPPPPA